MTQRKRDQEKWNKGIGKQVLLGTGLAIILIKDNSFMYRKYVYKLQVSQRA